MAGEGETKKDSLFTSIPEAGADAGLNKNAAYAAADRGEIPTVRFGKLRRVPIAAWQKRLKEMGAL